MSNIVPFGEQVIARKILALNEKLAHFTFKNRITAEGNTWAYLFECADENRQVIISKDNSRIIHVRILDW